MLKNTLTTSNVRPRWATHAVMGSPYEIHCIQIIVVHDLRSLIWTTSMIVRQCNLNLANSYMQSGISPWRPSLLVLFRCSLFESGHSVSLQGRAPVKFLKRCLIVSDELQGIHYMQDVLFVASPMAVGWHASLLPLSISFFKLPKILRPIHMEILKTQYKVTHNDIHKSPSVKKQLKRHYSVITYSLFHVILQKGSYHTTDHVTEELWTYSSGNSTKL